MLPTTVLTRGRANPRHWKFPERLRRSRLAVGLHADALSLAANMAKNVVGRLEAGDPTAGRGLPKLPTAERLARALGRSPAWLAYGLGDATAPADSGLLRCQGLAERARAAREALGLSMREVSRRAELSEGVVRAVERQAQPGIDTLERLATVLKVSPAWLAYGLGDRELPKRGSWPRGLG